MQKTDLPALTLAVSLIASAVAAEPDFVRFGPHIFKVEGRAFQSMASESEVTARAGHKFQSVAKGLKDCEAVVEGPLGKARPRDNLRETWTIIQSIRVECWALLQASQQAGVKAATAADRITPRMIHRIMANSIRLATSDEEWSKTLMRFPGGELVCKNAWRCRLSLPDGRSPPERSLDYDLILAVENERFIMVTQLVHGRSGFVFGVHWRETPDGGEVIAIFPDILQ